MPKYTILKNSDDFYWYKQELDVAGRHKYNHRNTPEEFPCGVISEPYVGPYTYIHNFIYQQEVKCSECGHTSLVWPEQI